MKICVITCWYGKYPWYFQLFIHSCRYNPSIDFVIITDNLEAIPNLPKNIFIFNKTFQQIKTMAEIKLGFPISLDYPYKLCDFKPTYGYIFSEIVKGYDFWAHADIDLIYGNIRHFITDDLLREYDLISVRPDWAPGCFLLFKNCYKMNTLFTHSKDYKKVFLSSHYYCFDETNFHHDAFSEGKKYYEIPSEIESMMHVVRRLEDNGYIRPYFDLHIIEGRPGKLKWEKGILVYKNKYEALLYHFIKLKEVYSPKKVSEKITDTIRISPTRIYS